LNLSRIDEWIETFGLTILEALAFGIPVIVPPVGGPSEIVFDGKEGFLISSYEIDAIAQKIAFLSINPEICFELSRNAKKRSLDFMEEEFNAKILKFLNA
jgi:glycosyltransferase involved in cell wall biosynthesis